MYIILAIFGVAGLVAVNAVASHFRKDARALRAFRKMPQRFVSEFSERESAKIVGKVSYLGEPLRSPLTGRECAAYSIVIQSCFEESPEGIRRWSTVIRESSGQEFSIDDGTGHAIVDPTHAEFGLVTTSVTESGARMLRQSRRRAFLPSISAAVADSTKSATWRASCGQETPWQSLPAAQPSRILREQVGKPAIAKHHRCACA